MSDWIACSLWLLNCLLRSDADADAGDDEDEDGDDAVSANAVVDEGEDVDELDAGEMCHSDRLCSSSLHNWLLLKQ